MSKSFFKFSVSELKKNHKIVEMNPYTKNESFQIYKMDKIASNLQFSDTNNMRLKYAWGINKLSKFIRCYVNNPFKYRNI